MENVRRIRAETPNPTTEDSGNLQLKNLEPDFSKSQVILKRMNFLDDPSAEIRDSNNNRPSCSTTTGEQKQKIIDIIPQKFLATLPNSQSASSQIQSRSTVGTTSRVTVGTTYSDLSFSRFGHTTGHLLNRLLMGRVNRKPNKAQTKNDSLRVGENEFKKKSLLHSFFNSRLGDRSVLQKSARLNGGARDDAIYRKSALENHDPEGDREFSKLFKTPIQVGCSDEKMRTERRSADLDGSQRMYSNSMSAEFSSFFDPEPADGSDEVETENDSRNTFFRHPSSQDSFVPRRFTPKSEFNDEFLSPFEFNVENRRNRSPDAFTPANDQPHEIRTPQRVAFTPLENYNSQAANEEFSSPFKLVDCSQSVKSSFADDFFSRNQPEYENRVGKDALCNFRLESFVPQNDDSEINEVFRQRDSILESPVRDQFRDDENSFHLCLPDEEDVSHRQHGLLEITTSPSVIEATPYYQNDDNVEEEYRRPTNYGFSFTHSHTKVDDMIENGDEVFFRDSKASKSIRNYDEDVDDGVDVSTPGNLERTPELISFSSYIHDGRLIMEENNDDSSI